MDFELSPDQVALRDAARSLLADTCTSARMREIAEHDRRVDRALWTEMVAQGWPGVTLCADRGGLGLGFVELAILSEELGRSLAAVPLLGSALALHALSATDTPGHEPWTERILAGEIVAVIWGDGIVVDAPVADLVLVLDREGVRLHELAARPEPLELMDLTRSAGWVDGRHMGAGIALGGAALADEVFDWAAAAVANDILGASGRILGLTVEYLRQREQFGRPIGSFQAVKHRAADMLLDVEAIRSACYFAMSTAAAGEAAREVSLAASLAKSWSSEASGRVMAAALQLHGGIGYTWEHDLHFFLKRAQLDSVLFGDSRWHRRRLRRIAEERVELGLPVFA